MICLGISASLRHDSYNTRLLRLALKLAQGNGADAERIDLRDFPLPAYDGDSESTSGVPEPGRKLHERLLGGGGLFIASPEYNFSCPGHFKNTVDWLSRLKPMAWVRKPIFLLSASPGAVGGNRGLWHLRVPFEATGAFVFPEMFSLAKSMEAFDEKGELRDPAFADRLAKTVAAFLDYAKRLAV